MMVDKSVLQERLNIISQNFLLKLKQDLTLFKKFYDSLLGNKVEKKEWEEVQGLMHKITGSAKIFGFEELGKLAAKVEKDLNDKSTKSSLLRLSKNFKPFLDEAIKQLESRLQADKKISVKREDNKKYQYRVAVAEDNEVMRDFITSALNDIDCEVIAATDGDEILDVVDENLNLIMLAINLPKKDGFEVLSILNKKPQAKDIPVVMLTRKSDSVNIVKAISMGVTDYITKPFEVGFLKKRVTEILQNFKKKILIVDDDEIIHDILSEHFHRLGYIVSNAKNGKDALRMINKEKPDIVILDYMMPIMDGISVLQKIRSDEETSNISIIMLTVKSQQENILQGLKSGADDYVTKPFDIEELTQRIVGILERKNA